MEFREAVYGALRKLRHDVVAMEDYVAADERPLDRCLADVATCDLYMRIFAWRYGYVPFEDNPEEKSITELEYRCAREKGKICMVFLLHPKVAQWTPSSMDAVTGENEGGKRIRELRDELARESMVAFFKTPEGLATEVAVAVSRWERSSGREAAGPTEGTASYSATLQGNGAIAQGSGAVAAGKRGVAIRGNVKGGVIMTGSGNVVGKKPEGEGEGE
jgi:hypothetical protein